MKVDYVDQYKEYESWLSRAIILHRFELVWAIGENGKMYCLAILISKI